MQFVDKRTRRALEDAAAFKVGHACVYQGVQCVVLGRYYKKSINAIVYDLGEVPRTRGVYYRRIPQEELRRLSSADAI